MTLVVPNASEATLLQAALGVDAVLHLYTNVVVLGSDTVVGDLDEAGGGGYASVALGGWTVTPGSPSLATIGVKTFLFSGPLVGGAAIRGYYVTDAAGNLLWAEEKPAPFTPENNGDTFSVTLNFTLGALAGD